jgi:hypothetical protein
MTTKKIVFSVDIGSSAATLCSSKGGSMIIHNKSENEDKEAIDGNAVTIWDGATVKKAPAIPPHILEKLAERYAFTPYGDWVERKRRP